MLQWSGKFYRNIPNGRYYPDEDVIVSIVNAYLKTKNNLDKKIKLITETMQWKFSGELIRILYHDPMGRTPQECLANGQVQYSNLVQVLVNLIDVDSYSIEYCIQRQQIDGVSCGSLVAQSLCEIIDSYLRVNNLNGISFPEQR